MSTLWYYVSPTEWALLIWQSLQDFLSTLAELQDSGQILKLLAIAIVLLALSYHFIRYLCRVLFPTQPIEDLLHFKAAPAGYGVLQSVTMSFVLIFSSILMSK